MSFLSGYDQAHEFVGSRDNSTFYRKTDAMDKEAILQYLQELNQELAALGVIGEVCLYGGAVMCLVYEARPSTKDVDAIFQPTQQMRAAIAKVANQHNLRDDWLNDAVKGFVVQHPQRIFWMPTILKSMCLSQIIYWQ